MASIAAVKLVRRYLAAVRRRGIRAEAAVMYGSFARGDQTAESDIDLVVPAPEFDGHRKLPQIRALWHAAGETDSRIEPVPCGCREWRTDRARPILAIARQEGIVVRINADRARVRRDTATRKRRAG